MDPLFLNALNLVFGLARVRAMVTKFGSAKKAWGARPSALRALNIKREVLSQLLKEREEFAPRREFEKLGKAGIGTLTIEDEKYSPLLREIASPPLLLYYKGDPALLTTTSVAIVGTRAPSTYGVEMARYFSSELALRGVTIVSGLAQGIDALAHRATLEVEGRTIAVLGSGLHGIFPTLNAALAKAMLEAGNLIISEYPLGTPPYKQNFPARNRIIAGLSRGVLVIESRLPGGSLITAKHALEEGREVFAIPGEVTRPTSEGTNDLIRKGAQLVSSPEQILDELSYATSTRPKKVDLKSLSKEESALVELLETEPLYIDTLAKHSKLKPQEVLPILTSLELKGFIRNRGGNIFERLA
jgi:DNA processing protein